MDDLKEKSSEITDKIKGKVSEIKNNIKEKTSEMVSTRKDDGRPSKMVVEPGKVETNAKGKESSAKSK